MSDVNQMIQELADKRKADRKEQFAKAQAEKMAQNRAIYAKLQETIGPLLDVAEQIDNPRWHNLTIHDICSAAVVHSFLAFKDNYGGRGHGAYHYFYGTERGVVSHQIRGNYVENTEEDLSPADAVVRFIDIMADIKSHRKG